MTDARRDQIHMSLGMMEFATIVPATNATGSVAWSPGSADMHGTVKVALNRMMHDIGLLVVSCDKDGINSDGWHRYRVISVSARWTDKTSIDL